MPTSRDSANLGSAIGCPAIRVDNLARRFGATEALRGVSLDVGEGEVHALLGPNGAGKTTLVRVLTGLIDPTSGSVRLGGVAVQEIGYRTFRRLFGFIPSGDRSFYLRISGLENLVFFGRLHGYRRAEAVRRAWQRLEAVDLAHAARKPVGQYSHGMQKRLSVARALLSDPAVLIVDEATHDLDPDGAQRVRDLVTAAARKGAAVLWATQRLDEIREFASGVTVLNQGEVCFSGTVPELLAISVARRYVLHLRNGCMKSGELVEYANRALGARGSIAMTDNSDGEHHLLCLSEKAILGDAITALAASRIQVLACHEERSGIENAFLRLTARGAE